MANKPKTGFDIPEGGVGRAVKLAAKLGLPDDLLADVLLDEKMLPHLDDFAMVDAAVERAAKINDLCNMKPALKAHARPAIRSGWPMADVRNTLINVLADEDERTHTDGRIPSSVSQIVDVYRMRQQEVDKDES